MKKEFAILHDLESGHFLVNTTFNHDDDMYELSIKTWSVKMNGYATLTMSWEQNKQKDFEETFSKFKDVDFCIKWVNMINK